MKRNLFFSVMLILLLALGFVACDNNGGGGGDNGDINVVGFWDGSLEEDGESFPSTIQFRADGTFLWTALYMGQTVPLLEGEYELDGNVIEIRATDGPWFSITVTGNTLNAPWDDGYTTFTRR